VRLARDAEAALAEHRWPGNVRELRNVLERAVLLAAGDTIGAEDVRDSLAAAPGARPVSGASSEGQGLSLAGMEKLHIERTLREHQYRVPRAAQALGIPRSSLYERIRKYEIALPRGSRS
jgi:DNA-binding NtrC family response regulator